jgi:hypothetical protein
VESRVGGWKGDRVREWERGGDRNERVKSVLVSVCTHTHTRDKAGQDRQTREERKNKGGKGTYSTTQYSTVGYLV